MAWSNPGVDALRSLLARTRTIAVVGASPRPARPSHQVMEYLQRAGFRTIPVRPGGGEVLGEPCISALSELTGPVELIDVFRAPQHVPALVEQLLAEAPRLRPPGAPDLPALWLQDGVISPAAAQRARDAGLLVIMNDCLLRVHARLAASRPVPGGARA